MATPLRTEADVVRSLTGRAVTLEEVYDLCRKAGVAERDGGLAPIVGFGTDQVFKRRARCALQHLRRSGRAERVGAATWVIEGTREKPMRVLLIVGGEPSEMELALADAADLLRTCEEPADLVIADPPWALARQLTGDCRRDRGERVYRRDSAQVVGGYVEVEEGRYEEFTARWVSQAVRLLRPGAYLAVITGPSAAARTQCLAEDAGLTFVNQVVARKPFALKTTRRFSHSHTVVTILCAGPADSARRFFATPADLPKAASGADYPLDLWTDIPKAERPGRLRYDNSLAPLLVRRVVHALTRGPENGGEPWQSFVVDPFLGGGTSAIVCLEERRRFLGGDLNPESLRFVMARLAEEHLATPALWAAS